MRIRTETSAVVAALLLAACSAAGVPAGGPTAGSSRDAAAVTPRVSTSTLPADIAALGRLAAPADAKITAADALRVAHATGAAIDGATVKTFLIKVTQAPDIMGRTAWLIHYSGFARLEPGPPDAHGKPQPAHTIRNAYVFIDADTGEFLRTEFTE